MPSTDPVRRAAKRFKDKPGYASAMLAVMDGVKKINAKIKPDKIPTAFSKERLAWILKILDAQAAPFLRLVTDIESQEAFGELVNGLGKRAWDDYVYGLGTEPASNDPDMFQISMRVGRWLRDSFQRLASVAAEPDEETAPTEERIGYRKEVLDWMKRHEIPDQGAAAKRLGISASALKSIMSTKGQKRYGPRRLAEVLEALRK